MRTLAPLLTCLLTCTVVPIAGKDKAPAVYRIAAPPKPDFSALAWLLGEWSGKIGTKQPTGEVHFSAAYDLEQRFIILREQLWQENTKTAPASGESWMGVLSPRPDGKNWLLRVYSNYGFMTDYEVSPDGAFLHFNFLGGEDTPQGWLFRRTIERTGESEFTETVQVAPPDHPFFEYYSAKLTRSVGSKPASKSAGPATTPATKK